MAVALVSVFLPTITLEQCSRERSPAYQGRSCAGIGDGELYFDDQGSARVMNERRENVNVLDATLKQTISILFSSF